MSEQITVTAEEFLARQKDMLVAAINETNQDNELRGLRDHFAGLAMSGFVSNLDTWCVDWNDCAKHAYELADAMLAARGEL